MAPGFTMEENTFFFLLFFPFPFIFSFLGVMFGKSLKNIFWCSLLFPFGDGVSHCYTISTKWLHPLVHVPWHWVFDVWENKHSLVGMGDAGWCTNYTGLRQFSNFKLNMSKMEALNISLPTTTLARVRADFSFQWGSSGISYLEITIPSKLIVPLCPSLSPLIDPS